MHKLPPYRIYPLGDAALTLDFGNKLQEDINLLVLQLFDQIKQNPFPGMIEAVPAYTSLSVLYDPVKILTSYPDTHSAFEYIALCTEKALEKILPLKELTTKRLSIPVCYDVTLAPDLEKFALAKKITVNELVKLHSSRTYRVYMLGFLPGFGYMGPVDERISCNRKPIPEKVAAGSVGIAGLQTGIYPFDSQGGWQIIGRTPLKLFDIEKDVPAFLQPGDIVQFVPITKDEYNDY